MRKSYYSLFPTHPFPCFEYIVYLLSRSATASFGSARIEANNNSKIEKVLVMKVLFTSSVFVFYVLLAQIVLAHNSIITNRVLPSSASNHANSHCGNFSFSFSKSIVAPTDLTNCFYKGTINPLELPAAVLSVNLANIKPLTETVAQPDNFTFHEEDSLNPPLNLTISSILNEGITAIQLHWQLPDTAYQAAKASGSNSLPLTGFNIYRKPYIAFPAGIDTAIDINKFILIHSTDAQTTEYLDKKLPADMSNCVTYFVTAVYSYGESLLSNKEWECYSISSNSVDLTIAPNPSTSYINITLKDGIQLITVFNLCGRTVSQIALNGETNYTYYFKDIQSGMYNIFITSTTGKICSKKFLKF